MKRFLAGLIAMLLLLSVTACGDKTPPQSENSGTSSSAQEDPWFDDIGDDGTTAPSATGTAAPTKTQGTTRHNDNSSGWSSTDSRYTPQQLDTPYTLRSGIRGTVYAFTPFANEDTTKKAVEMFKKAYPDAKLTIVSTTYAARNEKLQALIRAGDVPDYVYGATLEYPFRAIKNLTMPIDEYIRPHPANDTFLMDNYTSWNGKRHCVIIKEVGEVMWYNTALFSSKGEKTPEALYKEGNWTWDTFAALAKRMTDTDKGVWGFSTDQDWIFPASVGQDLVRFENGKAVFNMKNNAKYIQTYQFFLDMILVQKSARPRHWDSYTEFAKGSVAMYYGSAAHYRQFDKAGMKTYACVPFPRRDKNSPYIAGAASMNEGFGIGMGAKNIEGGMAFGEMMTNAQLELTGNFTDPQFSKIYQMLQEAKAQSVLSWASGLGLSELYLQDFMGDARTGRKDLNTLINEYAPKFEAKLNDLFK